MFELLGMIPTPAFGPLRRLYHWILSWANHPWGTGVLAILAFLVRPIVESFGRR